MDAKYLEEIKAREQVATPGTWKVGDGTHQSLFNGRNAVISQGGRYVVTDRAVYSDAPDFNKQVFSNMEFIAHARTDIPALIAEVERLTDENGDYHHMEIVADGQQNQNSRLREIINAKDQQIATLKKALEMACNDLEMEVHWWDTPTNEIYAHYIQQAQEQEHKP